MVHDLKLLTSFNLTDMVFFNGVSSDPTTMWLFNPITFKDMFQNILEAGSVISVAGM